MAEFPNEAALLVRLPKMVFADEIGAKIKEGPNHDIRKAGPALASQQLNRLSAV